MKLDRFIKRPVLSTVISVLTVILGLLGLVSLPIEQYPDIAPPTVMVQTFYQGADAQTVQKSVLAPLEEQINGVEGMTYMTSTATNEGMATITIYFEQGYNADMAQVNVQNRVSQATSLLPAEVTKQGVTVEKRQTSNVLIMALTSDGRYDEKFLSNYADINIIPAVKRVEGVGDCQSIGLKSYTMRLWLDPARMKDHNLMPSDITGTDVLEEDKESGGRTFRFVEGPVFTNMLLADEINRTPPKTQAALLEAMQEHHITVGTKTYNLPEPFFVMATQNPIEQEGTYPLPEAQMDRFLFNIIVKYPGAEDEEAIIRNVTSGKRVKLEKVLDGETVMKLQDVVTRVPVAPHVIKYAASLARLSRPKEPGVPDFVKELVGWGAGPRAGISLINAAKAWAILHGRHHCTMKDVAAVALPVLRHRVLTTFAAEAAGVTSDDLVGMLLKELKPTLDLEI